MPLLVQPAKNSPEMQREVDRESTAVSPTEKKTADSVDLSILADSNGWDPTELFT